MSERYKRNIHITDELFERVKRHTRIMLHSSCLCPHLQTQTNLAQTKMCVPQILASLPFVNTDKNTFEVISQILLSRVGQRNMYCVCCFHKSFHLVQGDHSFKEQQ